MIDYLLAVIAVFSTSTLSCQPPSFSDWALFPVESGIHIYLYRQGCQQYTINGDHKKGLDLSPELQC